MQERPRDLIGVHCTHGFNRTGYLICAYLVIANDWECVIFSKTQILIKSLIFSPEAAVLAFASARPPGIYKQDYLTTLFERFGDKTESLTAPEKPTWDSENANDEASTSQQNGIFSKNFKFKINFH